jgi:DNA-binding SARP family transcriptional activator
MWIGLLGPLLVTTDQGQRALVSAGKQRSLLAALAVQAHDIVPADALAEAVWDSDLPLTWQATLRNYVRRLRNVLGDADGRRIATTPSGGYSLRVDDDELDLLAFESLRKRGFAAVRTREWQRASAMLSEAEALWRGTPFPDIPSRTVRDKHLPYLLEARLTVTEARIDADLRLSRALEVIPELQRLTRLHPERESFHGQLMLALYRGGRQGEALAAFRTARQFSITELGVEPGRELTILHQRILQADERLRVGMASGLTW